MRYPLLPKRVIATATSVLLAIVMVACSRREVRPLQIDCGISIEKIFTTMSDGRIVFSGKRTVRVVNTGQQTILVGGLSRSSEFTTEGSQVSVTETLPELRKQFPFTLKPGEVKTVESMAGGLMDKRKRHFMELQVEVNGVVEMRTLPVEIAQLPGKP